MRRTLFWKLFISMLAVVLLTAVISVQFEDYVHRHSSTERIDVSVDKLLTFRENLATLLANEELDEAAQTLLASPDYTKQFLIFDESDNEILGREAWVKSPFRSRFYRPLSDEFHRRQLPLDIEVNSYLGNRYYVETRPLMLFQPLLSPQMAGVAIRTALLVGFSAIVCYLLSRALTRRIRYLQQAVKQLANGEYHHAFPDNTHFSRDELGQLGRDVQHMATQLAESHDARKQILSDISHELRSPLARMQVAVEIARDKAKAADDNRVQLDRIETESERMNALIAQIIHLQQLQMNKHPAEKTTIDLGQLLQTVLDNVRYEYQNSNKQLIFKQPKKSINITGQHELLYSALENIIRNAVSHTHENTAVTMTLTQATTSQQVQITISDQGNGVAEADLARIFHPFARLDSSRNRKTGGHGLGLSIAKAVIDGHQGRITATNRDDGQSGLTVVIVLPQDLRRL